MKTENPRNSISESSSVITAANLITSFRILLVAPFLYLVWKAEFALALAVFTLASVTDFFDGYVARRFRQYSALGRVLDPLADKLLTTAAFVVMAIPRADFPSIPIWLAVAVVGRDALILAGAAIIRRTTGYGRFTPTFLGKVNTTIELALIVAFLATHSLGIMTWILPPAYALVLLSVLASGIGYLKRAASILAAHSRAREIEQSKENSNPGSR